MSFLFYICLRQHFIKKIHFHSIHAGLDVDANLQVLI